MQSRAIRAIAIATVFMIFACAASGPPGFWQDSEQKGLFLYVGEDGECTIGAGDVGFRCRYIRTDNGIRIVDEFKYPGRFERSEEPTSLVYDKATDTMVMTIRGSTVKLVRAKRT